MTVQVSLSVMSSAAGAGFSGGFILAAAWLEWLSPPALASLRADQCVPAGGFSLSVMLTTRSIAAAVRGGLRPGRVASRSSPATPRARQ